MEYTNPWRRPNGKPKDMEKELFEAITPILSKYRGGSMSKDRIHGIAIGAIDMSSRAALFAQTPKGE